MKLYNALVVVMMAINVKNILGLSFSLFENTFATDHFHHAIMDEAAKYRASWEHDGQVITFDCQVQTQGYFGFGFSPDGGLNNSDLFVGWFTEEGHPILLDSYGDSLGNIYVEESQDFEILETTKNITHIRFKFVRKLQTCDFHDRDVTVDTTSVIYFWNNEIPKPQANRSLLTLTPEHIGWKHMLLLDYPMRQSDIPVNSRVYEFSNQDTDGNDIPIPDKRTVHWCKIVRFPILEKKHHIVKFEASVKPGMEGVVHHIMLYSCPQGLPEEMVGEGYFCHSSAMPKKARRCMQPVIAWAVGSQSFVFPPYTGLSIGTEDDPVYLVMETHFDNPSLKIGLTDGSGIRFYYTSSTRDFDSGLLEVGHVISPYHIIPPGQKSFKSYGYCMKDCLAEVLKTLPERQPMWAFGVLFHSHSLATGMRTRHFRGDQELSPLAEDWSYNYNYQETRYIPDMRSIRSTDTIMTECTYDTTKQSNITIGGHGIKDEMCISYILHYPRMRLTKCNSQPVTKSVSSVLAFNNITVCGDRVDNPVEYRGESVIQALAKHVDWQNPDVVRTYWNTITYGPLVSECLYSDNVTYTIDKKTLMPPVIETFYKRPSLCSSSAEKTIGIIMLLIPITVLLW